MENNQQEVTTPKNKPEATSSKKMLVVSVALGIIILVALIFALTGPQKIINNIKKSVTSEQSNNTDTSNQQNVEGNQELAFPDLTNSTSSIPSVNPNIQSSLQGAKSVITGANPVKDNKVITMTGEVTVNSVEPMSPQAPQQTIAIDRKTVQNNKGIIKIDVTASAYIPSSFTVKAGEAVTIAATSVDNLTHIFAFTDPSLQAVALGLAPGETRAITFNAPTKPGEYEIKCGLPGHSIRGEVGKMIVK